MAAARPILGLISFILLAGGILLQFLVILSGGVNSNPENKFYFLQADTSAIQPTPRNPSRWTFFAICGVDANGLNANCGNAVPALPFDPVRNFGTSNGVPASFIGTNKFYYLSRFMFAFYLIALFFACISLLTGLLALCSRLGGYISGLNTAIALFFQLLAAALMTSWVVIGRNNFRSAGLAANIGAYSMGFTWASAACFMICTVLYCVGGSVGKNDGYSGSRRKGGFMGRSKSTRSRGSFIDTESQRKVREDYD